MDWWGRLRIDESVPEAGQEVVEDDEVHRWKELKFDQKQILPHVWKQERNEILQFWPSQDGQEEDGKDSQKDSHQSWTKMSFRIKYEPHPY